MNTRDSIYFYFSINIFTLSEIGASIDDEMSSLLAGGKLPSTAYVTGPRPTQIITLRVHVHQSQRNRELSRLVSINNIKGNVHQALY